MIKRLNIYFNEMYPILPRLLLAIIVFCEIYFIILLNNGITDFDIGIQEIIGGFTIFGFLMWLRIADDFKDYETDKKLFPKRALPSGKVKKSDLILICLFIEIVIIILNFLFMNNIIFFLVLYLYGFLMSEWFFQKSKIQPSLPLALITHNPVQMFVNLYIISFTCIKYNLKFITLTNILALWTLYFPALIWEVSRKIKSPEEENDYTTYSKLFGYKKSIKFVFLLTWIDILTNVLLVINLNKISVILLLLNVLWMSKKFIDYMKNPTFFKIVDKVEKYTFIQETLMLITVAMYLIMGKI